MKIKINGKEVETAAATLLQLSEQLSLPAQGVAVAVNNQLISRTAWSEHRLGNGDMVVIIKAACGG